MKIPILKFESYLIATIQDSINDTEWKQFQSDIMTESKKNHTLGVVIDAGAIDVMDSFATRTLGMIVQALKLLGVKTVIAGIQPEVAFSMVRLGIRMEGT